jgi:phosphatidylglycerophosphate synthase
MIARLKGTGTKTGRIIDGFVDYVVGLAIYIGLAVGLQNALEHGYLDLPFHPWILVILAGISAALHSFLTDNYRNAYETYAFGKKLNPQEQVEEFTEELERLEQQKGRKFDKLLIRTYLKYSKLQTGSAKMKFTVDRQTYRKYNKAAVLLWNLIGPTTHISVMMISLFLYEPLIFFGYTIIFANIWMIIMMVVQHIIYRRMNAATAAMKADS